MLFLMSMYGSCNHGIPNRFLALIVLIDPGLDKPERCAQFTDICAGIAVLQKHFQRSGKEPLFRIVCHKYLILVSHKTT